MSDDERFPRTQLFGYDVRMRLEYSCDSAVDKRWDRVSVVALDAREEADLRAKAAAWDRLMDASMSSPATDAGRRIQDAMFERRVLDCPSDDILAAALTTAEQEGA